VDTTRIIDAQRSKTMSYWNDIERKVNTRTQPNPQQETISVLGFVNQDTQINLVQRHPVQPMLDEHWVSKGYFDRHFSAIMQSILPDMTNHRELYDLEFYNHVVRDKRFNESKLWVYNIFAVGDKLRQGQKNVTVEVDVSDYLTIKTARAQQVAGSMCSVNAYLYCRNTDEIVLQKRANTEYENGFLSLFGGGNTPFKGDGLDLYTALSREVVEETQGLKAEVQHPLPSLHRDVIKTLPWVVMTENFLGNQMISGSIQFNTVIEITEDELNFFETCHDCDDINNNYEGRWAVCKRKNLIAALTEGSKYFGRVGFSAFTKEFLKLTLEDLGEKTSVDQSLVPLSVSSNETVTIKVLKNEYQLTLMPSGVTQAIKNARNQFVLAYSMAVITHFGHDLGLKKEPVFVFGRKGNWGLDCKQYQVNRTAFYEMLWFDLLRALQVDDSDVLNLTFFKPVRDGKFDTEPLKMHLIENEDFYKFLNGKKLVLSKSDNGYPSAFRDDASGQLEAKLFFK
jgi:hypothetical protein